ncbi:MAG: aminoglycoside phosphotransferase family protein [Alphaproteobacteria bacterium]|nr:aminoglycoside phosphotransferase family protein [Alphaproteobacteria bacterium]MBL6938410.1 aminoglycoside phosphotransferase family protein [Alphaproteobacteria bacterium]MBL7096469.1 aminoglycoside phosphotransferase family protein [Alphaproteobacteria bacterium]
MDVTPEQLQPMLRSLGLADAAGLVPMTGGSAPVFRIDCADGTRLILKAYPDNRPWNPEKDAYAAGLLRDLGLPVTRYYAIDQTKARLPFRFALTNYLPGVPAEELRDDPEIADVYLQMGALIRQLHDVKMPGYGHVGAQGVTRPLATNVEFLRAIIAETFERFVHFGGDKAMTRELRRIADARFDAVVPFSKGPVFAHDDVHPNNVLVVREAGGRLKISGLIDFGNARAADAVYDLAKCIFISQHQAPDCRRPMLEGYGAIDHPDPESALAYYTIVHRMSMWWWLRHIGELAADEPHEIIDRLRETAASA